MKRVHYGPSHYRAAKKRVLRRLATQQKNRYQRQRECGSFPKKSKSREVIRLIAPKRICLYLPKNQKKLANFLARLRYVTLTQKRPVEIELTHVKSCGASGTLLFLAEIDRIYHISGCTNLIRGTGKIDNKISQVLKHIGLDRRLNIHCKTEVTSEDVKHWRHISGVGTTGETVGPMLENLKDDIGEDIVTEIYGAYVDAIDNVSGHAYEEPRYAGDKYTGQRWWVFAQIRDGSFITSACDLGMGIPRSLPTKGLMEEITKSLNRVGLRASDKNLIKVAFELNRTRTAQKKHGKGLQKMRSLIDKFGRGSLSIYSNSGIYRYSANENGEISEVTLSGENILGTIVEWNIPIEL